MATTKTFVLYPLLGVGHLIPMVELAKHLLAHGLRVMDPSDNDAVFAGAVAHLAAANLSIAFRLLPAPASLDLAAYPVKRSLDTLRLANPVLRDFLRSLPAVDALDVAAELAVPTYFFFASAVGDLVVFLKRITEGRGVQVNSFDWLERRALKALEDGVCVPGRLTPRVYCIAPLVDDGKKATDGGNRHEWARGGTALGTVMSISPSVVALLHEVDEHELELPRGEVGEEEKKC